MKLSLGLIVLLSGLALFGDSVLCERLNYRIILPDHASNVQIAAGNELQYYLEKIYREPIQFNGQTPGQFTFLIGFPIEAIRLGFVSLPALCDYPGEFGLFAQNNAILFSGQDEQNVDPWTLSGKTGTLLSVYYFLEKYTGVTFFAPGAKGENLTLNPPLTLPPQDLPKPAYEVRGFSINNDTLPRQDLVRFFKQRLCSVPRWATPNLNYQTLNRWNKRFAQRPELFALYGDKRVNKNYPYHVPCLSNPAVFEIIMSDLLAEIAQRGDVHTIRIFGSDAPIQPCECTDCRQFADGSDYVYTFINRVAGVIRQAYPEMNFYTQEKGKSYCHPPQGVVMAPRFTVAIETGYPSQKDYSKNFPLFEAWQAAGARTIIRGYPRMPEMQDYLICNQGEIVKMLCEMQGKTNGMLVSDGTKYRQQIHYACCLLTNSIQARALFDPTLNLDQEIRRFCDLAYPGAGLEMAAFYTAMQKIRGKHSDRVNPLIGQYASQNLDQPAELIEIARKNVTDPYWLQPVYDNFLKLRQDAEKYRPFITLFNNIMADYPKLPQIVTVPVISADAAHDPFAATATSFSLFPRMPYTTDFQGGSVAFAADAQNLYVHVTAHENDLSALKADCSPEHKTVSIFSDDCFEIMFAHAEKDSPFVQIAVNPKGHFLTLEQTPDTYRTIDIPGLNVSATSDPTAKCWSVKLTIPLAEIRHYCADNRGRVGIFRSRPGTGGREAQISGIPAEGYTNHSLHDYKKLHLPPKKTGIFSGILNWLTPTK